MAEKSIHARVRDKRNFKILNMAQHKYIQAAKRKRLARRLAQRRDMGSPLSNKAEACKFEIYSVQSYKNFKKVEKFRKLALPGRVWREFDKCLKVRAKDQLTQCVLSLPLNVIIDIILCYIFACMFRWFLRIPTTYQHFQVDKCYKNLYFKVDDPDLFCIIPFFKEGTYSNKPRWKVAIILDYLCTSIPILMLCGITFTTVWFNWCLFESRWHMPNRFFILLSLLGNIYLICYYYRL
jgi:hypothetical protein